MQRKKDGGKKQERKKDVSVCFFSIFCETGEEIWIWSETS